MKKNNFGIILAGIAVVLILGLWASIIANLSSVIIPEYKQEEATGFGGVNLISSDFRNDNAVYKYNGGVKSYGGSPIVLGSDMLSSYYLDLYLDSDKIYIPADEFDIVTIDFDFNVINLTETMTMGAIFRTSGGDIVKYGNGFSRYIYVTPSLEEDGTYNISIVNQNVDMVYATVDSYFHLTFVYVLNHDDYKASRAHVYVDGEYCTEIPAFVDGTFSRISIFRIYQESSKSAGDRFSIYNYSVNAFERGYTGALSDVLSDFSIDLQYCPDSVLFGK